MHYTKHTRWPVWLALILILTTSLTTTFASSLRSGVDGRVVAPGLRSIFDLADVTHPAQATVSIYSSRTGRLVTTVHTDSAGKFRVPLAPGDYRVQVPPIVLWRVGISWSGTSAPPVRVRVRARQFAPVTVAYGYFRTVS